MFIRLQINDVDKLSYLSIQLLGWMLVYKPIHTAAMVIANNFINRVYWSPNYVMLTNILTSAFY
jgi:hypothetical protein